MGPRSRNFLEEDGGEKGNETGAEAQKCKDGFLDVDLFLNFQIELTATKRAAGTCLLGAQFFFRRILKHLATAASPAAYGFCADLWGHVPRAFQPSPAAIYEGSNPIYDLRCEIFAK